MGGEAGAERTYVVADIAGSCALWNRHTELMNEVLADHDRLAGEIVAAHGGVLVKYTGDGFLAEFESSNDAIEAMLAYQAELADRADLWAIAVASRVAIHRGSALDRDGDRFGPTINHLMRIAELVEPNHVVVTGPATAELDADVDLRSLGVHRVRDVPQPLALHAVYAPHASGPALTVDAGRGLPDIAASFVGRGGDAAQLREMLERHRLCTVTGFGGAGKTRLAVEVARLWSERHGHATHFVDLVSEPEPAEALAVGVGVVRSGGDSALDDVVATIAERRVLLVVDNCEHVIDRAAEVVEELVERCPGVVVLATSREPLALSAEAVHAIGGLDDDAALRLLERRLSAAAVPMPSTMLASQLVDAVDRLPLGIELIAARLATTDPAVLVDQLASDPQLVRSRRRNRTARRHESLAAVIDWSLGPLIERERRLLWLLAHFAAPAPLVAATWIAPDDADALDDLFAKSLVQREGGHVRMLGIVRQRVLQAGAPSGDAEAGRHALIAWAKRFAPAPRSRSGATPRPSEMAPARSLAAELANLDAALEAAVALGHSDDEATILAGLWPMITQAEGRGWFDRRIAAALGRIRGADHERIVLRLALTASEHRHVGGGLRELVVARLTEIDPERTDPMWRSLEIGEQLPALLSVPITNGDPEVPRDRLRALHDAAVAADDVPDQLTAQLFLAFSHLLGDDPASAAVHADRAAAHGRRMGVDEMVALADATAAMAMTAAGEHEAALHVAASAVPLANGARWESVVQSAHLLARLGVDGAQAVRAQLVDLLDFVLDDGVPFVIFDGVAVLAAWTLATGDEAGTREVLYHSSISRSPATIAVTWHTAQQVDFDLGVERFLDSFDADAFARRADGAAAMLREQRAKLIDGLDAPVGVV